VEARNPIAGVRFLTRPVLGLTASVG
jgi:hypothetical protein